LVPPVLQAGRRMQRLPGRLFSALQSRQNYLK
jgi:hypothetical protein